MRRQRLEAEANMLKTRLKNNGYGAGLPIPWNEWDTMPKEHKDWQSRLWYIGMALVNPNVPE